ncbi:MAG: helix-turn-helix transcriptional regulator [Oscillospiraceae bacterium]|jgi:transcriptional regulator with XRE-family HTH domain|nr:helix-turn-helix transcriptional regulator [Oscillospiraceae bacterium]
MLPQRLKALREGAGLSQRRVAAALDVTQQAVASWETGRCSPGAPMLARLARLFAVSADYLVGSADVPYVLREAANAPSGEADFQDVYLSMAKRLRDGGVSERDLGLLLALYNERRVGGEAPPPPRGAAEKRPFPPSGEGRR